MSRNNTTRTALLLFATSASVASLARADVINATWLGGAGSWNDPTKWSGGVVPNNNGTTTFRVVVPTGSVTTSAGSGSVNITVDALMIGGGGTLSVIGAVPRFNVLSSTVQVDGGLISGGTFQLGSNGLLTGTGTITLMGFGVGASSGGLTVDSGLTVTGTYGYLGRADQPLVNRAHIIGGAGPFDIFALAGTPLANSGVVQTTIGGRAAFDGTFTRADLGNLVASPSGKFIIRGTLLNQGQTLPVDANNPWMLAGTIQGGTIQVAAGQSLSTGYLWGATLDDVWLNGRYAFGGEFGALVIKNGTLKGNAEIVLDQASSDGPRRLVSGTGSLVISASATVHGGGGFGSSQDTSGIGYPQSSVPVVNHGMILADFPDGGISTGELDVNATATTNDGVLGVKSHSLLHVFGSTTFSPGGQLQVEMGTTANRGMLLVNGRLHLESAGDMLSLTTSPGVQPFTYYRIASATAGITGTFDSVTPGFQVMYVGDDIFARVVFPEPAVAPALLPLAALVRRRRTT